MANRQVMTTIIPLYLVKSANILKNINRTKMNQLKIILDALVRKAQVEHKSQDVEMVLFFETKHLILKVDGVKVETMHLPERYFDMLHSYLFSLVATKPIGPKVKLVLLSATPKSTQLFYSKDDERLIHAL